MRTTTTPLAGAARTLALAAAAVLAVAAPATADTDGHDTAVVQRVADSDRVATAAAVAVTAFDHADTAVLVTGDTYADAITATPAAAAMNGPLLLTQSDDHLEQVVLDAVEELGVSEVVTIGGHNAVPRSLTVDLERLGIGGSRYHSDDRYGTALAVEFALTSTGPVSDHMKLVASVPGEDHFGWPDALSAGAYAALGDPSPIMLTRPDELVSEAHMITWDSARATLIGGTSVLSERVEQEAARLTDETQRLAGGDRYQTSVAVADAAVDKGASTDTVWVATGANWPDGLAAAAAAAHHDGVLLLVDGDDPDNADEVYQWLADHQPQRVYVAGGDSAVGDDVLDRLADAVR